MSPLLSGHVSSDRLGEAARHASLDGLRNLERLHVERCEHCRRLYAGYRLTDRLLSANWRQVALPASALEQKPIRSGLAGWVDEFARNSGARRSLVPVALAACLVLAVGFGVLLPKLAPSESPSPSAYPALASQYSPSPTASATPDLTVEPSPTSGETPGASAEPQPSPGGAGPGPIQPRPTPAATPTAPPTPVPHQPGTLVALPNWPIAWSPDGSQLLVATGAFGSGQIQIRGASGGLTATLAAYGAAWFDSHTVAIATNATIRTGAANVSLVNLKGEVVATLPAGSGVPFGSGALLIGSGNGDVAVTGASGWGGPQTFVVWDGQSASASHSGVPIAFSRDGAKLAVLHPFGMPVGGYASGSLEIVAVPDLHTIASFSHTMLRVAAGNYGPGYAPDVDFSPDGNWLLASGTLVDLSRGSTVQVGNGGWLPDGTLITSSGGSVLRWQGTHATPDARFQAGGSIETSRHGDVIEFFRDKRPPLLLAADGGLGQLELPGVASLDALLLAPDGGAVAIEGRGADGGKVTAIAPLK